MRRLLSLFLLALLALGTLGLTACGSDDKDKPDAQKAEEHADEAPRGKSKIHDVSPICPQVAVVRGLDLLRDYGRETGGDDQLVAAARLLKVEGTCEYTDAGVDVLYSLNMAAKRGPRLGGAHYSLPLFVAIMDPSGQVVDKNQMAVDLTFSSDDKVINHAEAMHVFIPMNKMERNNGPSYRILTGFQLSPEQATEAKAKMLPR